MSLNNMTMTFGTVTYRQDGALWWAEDSEMPGWTAVGATQQEVQRLHGEAKLFVSLQRELDAERARAEVLAAECRAWREHWAYTCEFVLDGYSLMRAARLADARQDARAATDAAGALEVKP